MKTDNVRDDEYDAALGGRLSHALRAEADSIPVPSGAWSRFLERDVSGSGVMLEMAPLRETSASTARHHPWRIPLIAAASVVAIAVATSAIVTGGFGGDGANRPAAPAATVTTNAAGEVGVPFNASPEIYAAAPQPTVWLKFTGGAPPTATLETRFQTADKLQTVQYDPTRSNGTPLGYLAHMVSVHGGPAGAVPPGDVFLWGAVGPEVAQVRIVAAGAHWTFDSGSGTAFSAAGDETATWTALPDDYHAFAVRLSADVEFTDVIALGPSGNQLQIRRFDTNTGQLTDLPVPPTGTPGGAPNTAPATTSTATSQAPPDTPVTGPVPVPIETDYLIMGPTGGFSTRPPRIGANAQEPPLFGLASIQMGFVNGAPPAGTLRGRYVRNTGALVTKAMDQKSDGSPLGYVARENALNGGTPYGGGFSVMTVWGAVGPDVDHVEIVSDLPFSHPAGTGTSADGMRARWDFVTDTGSGADEAGNSSRGASFMAATPFTTLEGGYRGFVFQLPKNATWADVTAFGPRGQVLQTRRFD